MTLFKNSLMRRETPVANAGPSSARKLEYRLPGGRTVQVEEFCFRVSTLGFLAGREERIREKIVEEIPKLLLARYGDVMDRVNFYAPYRSDPERWAAVLDGLRAG